MPLVDDIVAITKLETQGDAIIMAQDEIEYLDDLSFEGDIPDGVSDIIDVQQKGIFTGGAKFCFCVTKLGEANKFLQANPTRPSITVKIGGF
jgi:hypothetical protein